MKSNPYISWQTEKLMQSSHYSPGTLKDVSFLYKDFSLPECTDSGNITYWNSEDGSCTGNYTLRSLVLGKTPSTCANKINSKSIQITPLTPGGDYYKRSCWHPALTTPTAYDCFSGLDTVIRDSGEVTLLKDVKVGDRILTSTSYDGPLIFSQVIAIPHSRDNKYLSFFINIETLNEMSILLTSHHLIFAGDCHDHISKKKDLQLTKASNVQVGQCVSTVEGTQRVTKISESIREGVYSVVTENEFLVVSGFIVSPFAVNHKFTNYLYSILRGTFHFFPLLLYSRVFTEPYLFLSENIRLLSY